MTGDQLIKEIDDIVSEMTSWREQNKHLKGPCPGKVVRQRELVMFRRQLLYKSTLFLNAGQW